MRNFISMFVMLALVITTSFAPSTSHAMSHDDVKTEKTETAKGKDCHHGEAKAGSQEAAHNDKDASGKCCDKGMCKCVGGNCHSLSKYLGDGNNSLAAFSSSISEFAFDNQLVDSALANRLKRPPKA